MIFYILKDERKYNTIGNENKEVLFNISIREKLIENFLEQLNKIEADIDIKLE